MSEQIMNIDIAYSVQSKCETDWGEDTQLAEFFKMYDKWKEIFDRTPIIESYANDEFAWFIQENHEWYTDENGKEIEGEFDAHFIGFCIIGPWNCIEFIWLNPEHRGRGLGRKMVELSGADYYDFPVNDSIGFWENIGLPSKFIKGEDGMNRLIPELENQSRKIQEMLFGKGEEE